MNEPATDKLDHGAVFDGPYRYLLWRTLSPIINSGTILFVMLNPSTATATEADPTIRRVMDFADRWGYKKLQITNAFALRSTRPEGLLQVEDPVGPENDRYIEQAALEADKIVVAWGAFMVGAQYEERLSRVLLLLPHPVYCLGTTENGSPRHPLYLRKSIPLSVYSPPSRLARLMTS